MHDAIFLAFAMAWKNCTCCFWVSQRGLTAKKAAKEAQGAAELNCWCCALFLDISHFFNCRKKHENLVCCLNALTSL